ncbi:MAG: HEPN domain-containing protein [Bacteroidales bacterium]|jgi:uncharacterized protein (UPF0332 family)|nr:HEPN domain-containing protein [Bacteroidales bacterium]
MNEQQQQYTEYLAYRIAKSEEAYKDACLLTDNGAYNAAINRYYYATFYIVSALLLKHEIFSKSHSGMKTEFAKHFVKTDLISMDCFKTFSDLMDWRHKGDYGDMFDFDAETAQGLKKTVRDFIDIVKQKI